jgi:hypothetical protein
VSLEHISRETDKEANSQKKSNDHADVLKQITEKKDAETREKALEDRKAEEQQQRETIESPQRHQKDPDRANLRSVLFGLNLLQDMQGNPDKITGAYDPKQELWIRQGQVQVGLQSELPTPNKPSTTRNTTDYTERTTWNRTYDEDGGDMEVDTEEDSRYDTDTD